MSNCDKSDIPNKYRQNRFHDQSELIIGKTVSKLPSLRTAMESTSAPKNQFLPSVLLSNVMSLAPKIDEIQYCVMHANFGLVCLTETWLKDCSHDQVLSISGFNIVRLDRKSQIPNQSIRLYFTNNSLTQTLIRSLSTHNKVYI